MYNNGLCPNEMTRVNMVNESTQKRIRCALKFLSMGNVG